jgi:hypothetical protein
MLTAGASLAAPQVRRPIDGLVHDNYPPGLAATYHFIPKQTTDTLYITSLKKSRGFSNIFREIFKNFAPQRPQNALFTGFCPICVYTRIPACLLFHLSFAFHCPIFFYCTLVFLHLLILLHLQLFL